MPELPEVQTTTTGLRKILPKLSITNVWTDLAVREQRIPHFRDTLKDEKFFTSFKRAVINAKVLKVERRAKNILILLDTGKSILIHMKMTGHLMVGRYSYDKKKNSWSVAPEEKNDALRDPFNRFIHVVFSLSNGTQLVFCDSRKFGKVTLVDTDAMHDTVHLKNIGPEPLTKDFSYDSFVARLMTKQNGKIKQVLMDQSVLAGIGNIYSDEMLWLASIHPLSTVKNIPAKSLQKLFTAMREVLEKGIDFGGDSTSDYRHVDGNRGTFHHAHNVYQKKGELCGKRGCSGTIVRTMVGSRSAHFCPTHQVLY